MVFAATGSASFDFYGANRIGDNLFANCVLALDARTGKRIWHFQGVKHDVWDLDFPAAPSLVTVTRDGQKVDAVAQITKTGYVYVLDRKTGKPLFPVSIAEGAGFDAGWRKAGADAAVPGEAAAVHAPGVHRGHDHQPHAGGARGGAGTIAQHRFERDVHAAEPARHDAVARHRWRRRVGRRGVRSGDGAALRELERAAVDHPAWSRTTPSRSTRTTAPAATATI